MSAIMSSHRHAKAMLIYIVCRIHILLNVSIELFAKKKHR